MLKEYFSSLALWAVVTASSMTFVSKATTIDDSKLDNYIEKVIDDTFPTIEVAKAKLDKNLIRLLEFSKEVEEVAIETEFRDMDEIKRKYAEKQREDILALQQLNTRIG